jgi:hypothetical protein
MVVHFIPVQRCVQMLESLTGATPSPGFVLACPEDSGQGI